MPSSSAPYRPDPRILTLGPTFFDPVQPARFPQHTLRFRNQRWASQVGLAELDDATWERHFGRLEPLPDSLPEPLALRYHGHQFMSYNARLGDGRGFLLAQLRDPAGRLLDLGTKGSGQTPYSRGGDGRLTLKGGVREILATELLEARGVYTSKTFSLFETGEALIRGDEPSPTRSSVLVRLGHSHIRFGTFQRLAYHSDQAGLRALVDYCIAHFYPELSGAPDTPAALLAAVAARSAALVASWTAAGFVHGVLNTDNMNICGESFDYGPWRFLPTLDRDFVAAYFDEGGLYRFGRQPAAVYWNLEQLGRALSSIGDPLSLGRALQTFEADYLRALTERLLARLGVASQGPEADDALARTVFHFLDGQPIGYDQFFFDWYGGIASYARAMASPQGHLYQTPRARPLLTALAGWAPAHPERLASPVLQAPRPTSLLIDEVEALWQFIDLADNWQPLSAHIARIRDEGRALYGYGPPEPEESPPDA